LGEEMKLTPERMNEIIFHASQFHHNQTSIENIDAERTILELLSHIEALEAEKIQMGERWSRDHKAYLNMISTLGARVEKLERIKKAARGCWEDSTHATLPKGFEQRAIELAEALAEDEEMAKWLKSRNL
jgi:hypothetical protein